MGKKCKSFVFWNCKKQSAKKTLEWLLNKSALSGSEKPDFIFLAEIGGIAELRRIAPGKGYPYIFETGGVKLYDYRLRFSTCFLMLLKTRAI